MVEVRALSFKLLVVPGLFAPQRFTSTLVVLTCSIREQVSVESGQHTTHVLGIRVSTKAERDRMTF